MSKTVLDLIVTHYDEPWEVGKKFFDMLSMQRDVDLSDLRVIIIQDGEKGNLEWRKLLDGVPYSYNVKVIKHAGVSGARNAGIELSDAEWVMFCDFDDVFTNVCSLKLIMNVLTADDSKEITDVAWMETWLEEKRHKNFVNILKENPAYTYSKIYRREVLIRNNIRFDTYFEHYYEAMFNDRVYDAVPAHRVKKIKMPVAAYMKTLRDGSYNHRKEVFPRTLNEMLRENIINAKETVARGRPGNVKGYTADALMDGYYALNNKPYVITDEVRDEFISFVKDNIGTINRIDIDTYELAMNYATVKIDGLVQYMYMFYKDELMPPTDELDAALEWIQSLDERIRLPGTFGKTGSKVKHMHIVERKQDERVVVYCGTRNTYESMLASAKSLLYHTPVDKIYFLTEDDEFPQPLPGVITNINISGQQYFKQDGPNFNNAWTYMCLMRGAFTKLFPQHSKVLSLDMDIAINDDISALFDMDMSNYYLAGVHEPAREQEDYINFGVVMMNLDKLRMDRLDDKIIEALNTRRYDCPEQTCFSRMCAGKIKLLTPEYNYTPHGSITGDTNNPIIYHYAGIKYWKHYSHFRNFLNMPWEKVLQ